ncbi:plasmid mobilization relaxosome protein MobC [Streptomyces venezuelae]|uniref:Plasmid mobilization relaxosome protein MobC n=1 Tax=Streptomyces venezuelae TaxID=54571 RepID=A0A5P2DT43_STRVZ|nr:plasmid mobilization relaxosome protein MobC [Streptomyces venezuelae]
MTSAENPREAEQDQPVRPAEPPGRDHCSPGANSYPGGASYRPRHSSPSGKRVLAKPAPGVAGADRSQGAPVHEAATEGGSQPEETPAPRRKRRATKNASRKRSPKTAADKRSYVCSVRLNDDEKHHLATAAAAARTSLPAFLARSALAAARDPEGAAGAIAGERELISEMFAARRHLGHVGNNLNQVARAINSGDRPADAHLDAVLTAVRRATDRVQAATDRLLEHR